MCFCVVTDESVWSDNRMVCVCAGREMRRPLYVCVRECTRVINGLMSASRFILSVCGERTKVAL